MRAGSTWSSGCSCVDGQSIYRVNDFKTQLMEEYSADEGERRRVQRRRRQLCYSNTKPVGSRTNTKIQILNMVGDGRVSAS